MGRKKNGCLALRLLMLSLLKLPGEIEKRVTEYRLYKKKTFTMFYSSAKDSRSSAHLYKVYGTHVSMFLFRFSP